MANVLICDDDDLVRRMLERILGARGHRCNAFARGEDALRWLETHPGTIEVLISDYHLPGIDGATLLRQVAALTDAPVGILMSGVASFSDACGAVNLGAVFRLHQKPFDVDELMTTVREAEETYIRRREQAAMHRKLMQQNGHLRKLAHNLTSAVEERTLTALDGLLAALDLRDPETQWHSRRVSMYARRLAEAMGLGGAELIDVEWGALLHDLGKIGVRDAVLLKPAALDADEWQEMRRHPALGKQILASIPFLNGAAEVVYSHHERWDGGGYPRDLRREEICIGARVFAVVDTYDAITSDRPYRKGRGYDAARDEIVRCSGTQFDPRVVAAFLAIPQAEWMEIGASVERWRDEGRRPTRPLSACA